MRGFEIKDLNINAESV